MGTTEILVSGGVAAILAAMVGGGLKAFGVELPILTSVRRQSLLALAGVSLLLLGLSVNRLGVSGDAPRDGKGAAAEPTSARDDAKAAAEAPAGEVPSVPSRVSVAARPEVPNITGLPFAAARQFLMQNSWAPINSASSPMANYDLGSRQQEIFDTGYFEAVGCSGTGMAPCLFRYRNPGGYVLEVVTVGEDLRRAVVNQAVIIDCYADPKPEAC